MLVCRSRESSNGHFTYLRSAETGRAEGASTQRLPSCDISAQPLHELSEIAPAQLFHATTHACSWKGLGSEARVNVQERFQTQTKMNPYTLPQSLKPLGQRVSPQCLFKQCMSFMHYILVLVALATKRLYHRLTGHTRPCATTLGILPVCLWYNLYILVRYIFTTHGIVVSNNYFRLHDGLQYASRSGILIIPMFIMFIRCHRSPPRAMSKLARSTQSLYLLFCPCVPTSNDHG